MIPMLTVTTMTTIMARAIPVAIMAAAATIADNTKICKTDLCRSVLHIQDVYFLFLPSTTAVITMAAMPMMR